ncbi:MAG: hypothetical protein WCL16_04380 [bacterium]
MEYPACHLYGVRFVRLPYGYGVRPTPDPIPAFVWVPPALRPSDIWFPAHDAKFLP